MFVFSPREDRYLGFAESLVGHAIRLGSGSPAGGGRHRWPAGRAARVAIDLLPDRVCLSPSAAALEPPPGAAQLGRHRHYHTTLHRPVTCPVARIIELGADAAKSGAPPPPPPRHTQVAVAAVVLLESADGRLLLTRRPAGMAAFPGVWVPPGGHLEPGETAAAAAARELSEEVGLTLPDSVAVTLLTAWESVYPASLDIGWPTRHHLVLYFHAKLASPDATAARLTRLARPEPREVDRLLWLDRTQAGRIGRTLLVAEGVLGSEEAEEDGIADAQSAMVPSVALDGTEHPVPLASLMSNRPDAPDRVTTGTKMALLEWLARTD